MLTKKLQEGTELEVGKTYCFTTNRGVRKFSGNGVGAVLSENDVFRITDVKKAKTWDSFINQMSLQYTVTLETVGFVHSSIRDPYFNLGEKYMDVIKDRHICEKYALAVDSKKVLSDMLGGDDD